MNIHKCEFIQRHDWNYVYDIFITIEDLYDYYNNIINLTLILYSPEYFNLSPPSVPGWAGAPAEFGLNKTVWIWLVHENFNPRYIFLKQTFIFWTHFETKAIIVDSADHLGVRFHMSRLRTFQNAHWLFIAIHSWIWYASIICQNTVIFTFVLTLLRDNLNPHLIFLFLISLNMCLKQVSCGRGRCDYRTLQLFICFWR